MEGVRMNLGLMKRHRYPSENGTNGEDEEMELNLGLSMNGRFGVDPASRKKLKRSSSISNLAFTVGAVDNAHARGAAFKSYEPLTRARSLPTETEEEWRRRKEARKKRMEKMKSVRVVIKDNNENGSVNVERILSQGSIGSGSSGSSDLDNNHQIIDEGSKQQTVAKTPPNGEQESANGDVNQSLKTTAIMDMPHVMTKQDGPNGSKVEGFLYRYNKGEEVKIVCVCHGMFLSPAEFVKHGGGGADVDQPLKHIVVNPFPIS